MFYTLYPKFRKNLFNSFTFLYFCLLPSILLVLLAEKFGGKYRIRIQNMILVSFSLLFFAWSGTQYLKVLLFLIFINYFVGIFSKKCKYILLAGVVLNLFVLFYYKYFTLIVSTYNEWFHKDLFFGEIIAPLGISFIVFQCISYLMDIYQKKTDVCKNLLDFSLYISYFPKFSQGPIVKYKDMENQIKYRKLEPAKIIKGLERFIVGLSKKVLIADILGQTYSGIFFNMEMGLDAGTAWIALLSFGLSLYMDFSGYSDMAIGMAVMMGFEFQENFNFPYLSTSITEFWRRWHISLGAWFREYLYFPMGGSRKGNVYLHLFIVFLATGIWHGAAWVYLFWGSMHGLCVVVERYIMQKRWYEKIPVVIRWAVTFLIVNIGWITFNVQDMEEFKEFVSYLLGMGTPVSFTGIFYLNPRLLFLCTIVVFGMIFFSRKKVQTTLLKLDRESVIFQAVKYLILLFCVYLCFITSVSEGYQPFLYFQF